MTTGPDIAPKRQPPGELPERIGKYIVEEYLGGGMCHVYRAKDTVIGKTVAVKILKPENNSDPESRDRFLREAQVAANMEHPNIVSVYTFVPDEERPYMVMEFLKGDDLATIIKQKRTGDIAYKLRIALQVAKALQYIHAQQIVFRDVKPENIHINASGVVKIMDFGIAKREDLNITRPGFTMGTAYYMAPEQIRGQEVTPLSDIYAYGILLFELFAGFRAISGETYEQVFYRVLEEPLNLEPLQQAAVPEPVIALIRACTAKDPAQRPQDLLEVCPILEREIDAVDVSKKQVSPNPVERPKSSHRMIWAGIVMVAVVSLILGIWFFQQPVKVVPGPLEGRQEGPLRPPVLPPVILTSTGEMVLIPAGTFLSGAEKKPEELPDFYIDHTEVTNEVYGKFCAATGKMPPAGFADAPPNFPAVNITIDDARQFARWAGKELPTVKKWEKAARGKDGLAFPWGNDADPTKANVGSKALVAVDAFPSGSSPWGALQMVGNVWEFVDEVSMPSPGAIERFKTLKPPATKDESWYLMMGGSFDQELSELIGVTFDTASVPARFRSRFIGFRCVKNPEAVQRRN